MLPVKGNFNPSHSYQSDTGPSSRCLEPGEGSQVNRSALEGQCKATPPGKSASSEAQLKCLYANTSRMGKNKRI